MKSALSADNTRFSLKPDAGTANRAVTATAIRGGECMIDICILTLILSGVALIANIAVCLYTLHLAKQAEHTQKMKGYVKGLLYSQTSHADGKQRVTEVKL